MTRSTSHWGADAPDVTPMVSRPVTHAGEISDSSSMRKAGVPVDRVNGVVDYALEQLPALLAKGVTY